VALFGIGEVWATASKAARNASGNSLCRFSARRRIPAHAVALKKYRRAISPVSSIEDSKHTRAPLRQAEELRVEHAPLDEAVFTQRHAFRSPSVLGDNDFASCQRTNHDSKVSAAVA
jgi:hypothetical protein